MEWMRFCQKCSLKNLLSVNSRPLGPLKTFFFFFIFYNMIPWIWVYANESVIYAYRWDLSYELNESCMCIYFTIPCSTLAKYLIMVIKIKISLQKKVEDREIHNALLMHISHSLIYLACFLHPTCPHLPLSCSVSAWKAPQSLWQEQH